MADKFLDDIGLTHYHGLIKNVLASLAVGQVPSYSSSSQLPADGKYQDTGNYIKLCVTEDDNKLHRYDVPTSGYVDVGDSTYYDLIDTLTSGSTSVTISNAKIHTTSTFEFYTDKFGLSPTTASVSEGSITLEFEAQSSDVSVKVRVS